MSSQEPLARAKPLTLPPLGPLSTTTVGLLGAVCLAQVFKAFATWNHYAVVRDDIVGVPGVGVADLVSAENTYFSARLLVELTVVAAVVMMLIWLWHARRNADLINSAKHRLGRGWTIGAWFCPVVQLWYPRMIVDDIWRTSRPDVPNDLHSVRGLEHSRLVRYWWYTLLVVVLMVLWLTLIPRPTGVVPRLRELAVSHTIIAVLLCVAALCLALVIRQITRWQSIPREPREDWRRA